MAATNIIDQQKYDQMMSGNVAYDGNNKLDIKMSSGNVSVTGTAYNMNINSVTVEGNWIVITDSFYLSIPQIKLSSWVSQYFAYYYDATNNKFYNASNTNNNFQNVRDLLTTAMKNGAFDSNAIISSNNVQPTWFITMQLKAFLYNDNQMQQVIESIYPPSDPNNVVKWIPNC